MKRIVRTVLDREHLAEVVKAYSEFDEFVFDVETKANDPTQAGNPLVNEVTWIALAGPGRVDAIPVAHEHGEIDVPAHSEKYTIPDPKGGVFKSGPRKDEPRTLNRQRQVPATYLDPPKQLTPGTVFEALGPLFYSERRKIGHNVKFDLATIAKYYDWWKVPEPYGDTIVAHFLLDENALNHKLGTLAERYLRVKYPKIGGHQPHLHPFSDAAAYAMRDAKYTWLLWDKFIPQIHEQRLWGVFRLEMDVISVLLDMEREGVLIDAEAMAILREELAAQKEDIERALWRDAGKVWNLDATNEKAWYVYEHRGHDPRAFTEKKGSPSTRAKDLEVFAHRDPLVAELLDYASVAKTLSTYVDGMSGQAKLDGRLHADFVPWGAATGRFSCRAPNLQNIPRVTDDPKARGRLIRSMFVSPEGQAFVAADYDQIELRVLAHFSQDPILKTVFEEGLDPHASVMGEILGKDIADVTKDERQQGKTVNFLIMYGGGPKRLAAQAGIGVRKAEHFMEMYWKRFAGVDQWVKETVKDARKHQVPTVRTILGRKRRLPLMRATDSYMRYRAERQAVNSVIQGSAADIIKLAMVRFAKLTEDTPHQLVLTVHDELIAVAPEDQTDECVKLLEEAMVGERFLDVPLTAEAGVATRWSEAK